ncbi:LicD family protein [Butyrivibrio sp. CB08]|uniref:LicD family protein n=1 Tax=Butyrivibrio sp. CB08 TaxID=2364879 RepID=UPI000EAA5058|nr:LicD family protein [Butyrivibrio sp. CB08]RKM60416.1 LicD family protein [Butyrivibrio sp. CB08]
MMIEVNQQDLKKLQSHELEMLVEVDRICKKNSINYTIIGGTLLGAVRHGGFIPWDDDADVAMLRPEYDRFCQACQRDLDKDRFYFQNMDITPGYRWGYAKIRRKGTVFLRENQEFMPYEQGVFLDIFPQDAVPDNKILREIHSFRCFVVRKILWSEIGKGSDKSAGMRLWYTILSKIPMKIVRKLYKGLIIDDNTSNLVRTLTFPAPKNKYGYRRCWIRDTADIQFEGKTFSGVRDYDGWLKWEFGDYMAIPPKEKQKVHPVTELKLDID